MPFYDDFGLGCWLYGNFGNDRVTVDEDGSLVSTGFGRDRVRVEADDVTVDLGFGNDRVRTFGDDTVVNGGLGHDKLLGGDGADSLWGNFGNDVIRTGKGADYALGNWGNDLTDTGEGLGIHFGGAGDDTFFISREIVGNNAQDTVIALDFGNGHDRLDIAPEILADIANINEGPVDLVPVLAAFEAEGLGVPEVGERLSQTFLGDLAFREVASFLEQFTSNEQGQILVDATTVTTNEGDTIIALGVTKDQLLAAVA
ncbi:calcium-binding protein [Microvirga calopogonii]|uniref:calcium-binding protein n=1 Tax=Microvirga calopogonii TaxID=2078013 RepID=UPI000E0D74AF|nr:calcium-binding protein [Microvirga calopogonii]